MELGKKADNRAGQSELDAQLTLVVLGCFDPNRDKERHPDKSTSTLYKVDLDNFESLLHQLNPSLEINLTGLSKPLHLSFKSLDDFHPDQLYKQLSELDLDLSTAVDTPQVAPDQESIVSSESNQQTLARLLGKGALGSAPGNRSATQRNSAIIESIVGRLVNDSLQDNAQGKTDGNSEKADLHESIPDLLRALLHHQTFQTLESHWRSLDWLLRNLESDVMDSVYVLNLSSEMWNSYAQQDLNITQTELYRTLKGRFGDHPSPEHKFILLCDKQISPSSWDITLLNRLGQLAESLGAHLIAGADDSFIPSEMPNSDDLIAWKSFKDTQTANRISLVLPRVLLRLPYGAQYDPIETFSFEELDQEWSVSDLLWGCPSYALAITLATYSRSNNHTEAATLTDCPAFAYSKESETHLQPCTEHLFLETELERIVNLGLIPIIGSRRNNLVKLPWYPQV